MKRPALSLLRRAELVERTHLPAPLEYDYSPRNRRQRRDLARALRLAARQRAR